MEDLLTRNIVNGIDLDALAESVEAIQADPTRAHLRFAVATRWAGKSRSVSTVTGVDLGGEHVARHFTIAADEPVQLNGDDSAPNPQELLMAAVNACMTVGYVTLAATQGITLDSLEIETSGELDVHGMLELDASVPVGYPQLDYAVRISGNGTAEQFEEIHRHVMRTSPNYFNLARPVRMNGTLAVG